MMKTVDADPMMMGGSAGLIISHLPEKPYEIEAAATIATLAMPETLQLRWYCSLGRDRSHGMGPPLSRNRALFQEISRRGIKYLTNFLCLFMVVLHKLKYLAASRGNLYVEGARLFSST